MNTAKPINPGAPKFETCDVHNTMHDANEEPCWQCEEGELNSCSCKSRLGGGDCMHTISIEDTYPTDEEMLAEGWKRDEDGCWRMPNKHINTSVDHDHDCAKWVPHCDCNKIYVDEWKGRVSECDMNGGVCFGMKLDVSIKCSCWGPRTEHWERDDGTKFDLHKRWYACSGSVYCCSSCGVEDHTGDINWEFHKCTPKPKPTYLTDNDDEDIPF